MGSKGRRNDLRMNDVTTVERRICANVRCRRGGVVAPTRGPNALYCDESCALEVRRRRWYQRHADAIRARHRARYARRRAERRQYVLSPARLDEVTIWLMTATSWRSPADYLADCPGCGQPFWCRGTRRWCTERCQGAAMRLAQALGAARARRIRAV